MGKTIDQFAEIADQSLTEDDKLLIWDAVTGTTMKASIAQTLTISGSKGGFSFTGGFENRGTPLTHPGGDAWMPLDLDLVTQQTVDQPWWPGAAEPNGIDLFGGTALPYDATRMFDFETTWSTAGDSRVTDVVDGAAYEDRTGTLRFDELPTGTTNSIRVDIQVTPMIANTTLDVGLWFQPRTTLDGAIEGSFELPGSPLFFGTGTVGVQHLCRPTTTMYIASTSDQFAYALPVVRSDNPILIEPISCLVQNIR